jgi:hypothetical protein
MKVNSLIAGAVISAVLALEAWTLKAVVDLKVQVAELSARVSAFTPKTQIARKS